MFCQNIPLFVKVQQSFLMKHFYKWSKRIRYLSKYTNKPFPLYYIVKYHNILLSHLYVRLACLSSPEWFIES
jgi:hypothetical protein